jgi:hypothetical protein
MKKRLAKKQITKVIGYMAGNGFPVYNHVSNSEYNGGTCLPLEEDCYQFEITYTRKRHGAPLVLRNRWHNIYEKLLAKLNKC